MNKTKRNILSISLAIALVLALTVTALAAWPSFQGHVDNNGRIATQPPITTPTTTAIQMEYNNTEGIGVGASPVIDGGDAYTLYNGRKDGARLQSTKLSATPPSTRWNIVVDATATNVPQISTPYLDITNDILYVGVTGIDSNGDYYWQLYTVTNLSSNPPIAERVPGAFGSGRFGTPITAATDTNPAHLYFGTFTGTWAGAYYQYKVSTGALVTFKPSGTKGDDFYLAGAAFVAITDPEDDNTTTDYVVFGSEHPYLYVRPVSDFGNPAVGNAVTLVNPVKNPGSVRSSIVNYKQTEAGVEVKYVLFTSGGSSTGILWQIAVDNLLQPTSGNYTITCGEMNSIATTSTPVISSNGYIYIGGYNGDGTGAIWAYTPGNATTNPTSVNGVQYYPEPLFDTGEVHSSVVVWSISTGPAIGRRDYIYFTANATTGTGYCYSYAPSSGTVTPVWSDAGNGPALQGFASDAGYLVYGDDSNTLRVIS
ncbi:MAG: hypothetical protein LBS51_02000 [Oscillospiraceae bacterium]|jgi:hypothetical protein|nr:hypothetical protein [Oscillospiraceae bacterium]